MPGRSRARFGPILSAVISYRVLPVTKEMTAERIGPNFARTLAGKIWPNPLCCHFLPVTKDVTAKRIGPNFARTLAGKIWSHPLCCHFLSEPSREDWTKFCQGIRGQYLVQSSLLAFLTGAQGHDSRDLAGKIWSNPLCCHFLPVTKEMTAKRIGANFARTLADKIWSNPLCYHFLPQPSAYDWTQFCQAARGQNWVQSSLLSPPTYW